MENPVREMTLREEIEALNEEMYSTIRNLTENNTVLLNACESLCRAMVIQRRAIDG